MKVLKCLCFVLFWSSACYVTSVSNCRPGDDQITEPSLEITDCVSSSCTYIKGRTYILNVTFTPSKNLTALRPSLKLNPVGYDGEDYSPGNDACPYIITGGCPLQIGEPNIFSISLTVADTALEVDFTGELKLFDQDESEIFCVRVDGTVVANSS